MEPTNAMVRAAIGKAVDTGLLARHAAQNEYDWEVMRAILRAALQTDAPHPLSPTAAREIRTNIW